MDYIGYLASVLIGIILGLIGGGGSILTVPVLVYLFKVPPEYATSYSLFIVGISAMLGSYRHYRLGNLKLKPAVVFAIPSIISLLLVRNLLLAVIPPILFSFDGFMFSKDLLIMVVFAILMIVASVSMIRKTHGSKVIADTKSANLVLIGFLIGMVTGFLGAGGGFLIIPALLYFANLPMKQAIGTSLLIIYLNSTIGFGGDILSGVELNYKLLITITSIAIFGMWIGTTLSKKIAGTKLKPAFGWFVLVMGVLILASELFH
jgi:uncharacterized membrane protein YfcA